MKKHLKIFNFIISNRMSQREASKTCSMLRSTIKNKLKNLHSNSVGRPLTFTNEEEKAIAARLVMCSNFDFPLDYAHLKMIVRYFLDKQCRMIDIFKEGVYPGKKWIRQFIKRNNLTNRLGSPLKHSRDNS